MTGGYSPLRAWLRRERQREWQEAAARDVCNPFWQMMGPDDERPFDVDRDHPCSPATFSNLLPDPVPLNELDWKRIEERSLATIPEGPARDRAAAFLLRARRRFFH